MIVQFLLAPMPMEENSKFGQEKTRMRQSFYPRINLFVPETYLDVQKIWLDARCGGVMILWILVELDLDSSIQLMTIPNFGQDLAEKCQTPVGKRSIGCWLGSS